MVRRCTENGTWSGTDLVCDEGIHTNGSTLKPAARKPNAILEILGKKRPSNACKFKTISFTFSFVFE